MEPKQYTLYKRQVTQGKKTIYYVQFRDPDTGKRLPGRSTGQTAKGAAENWCIEQLKRGVVKSHKDISFAKYAEPWWIWETCPYIKKKLARGASFGRRTAEGHRANLSNYILPFFDAVRLSRISPFLVEEFMLHLTEPQTDDDKQLANKTVNNILSTLRVMLSEAYRLGYIVKNPSEKIGQLAAKPRQKSILSLDEVKLLLSNEAAMKTWEDVRHFTLSLLAASTGMRLGECQGLQIQHVHEGYVDVRHSWGRKYGLKETKTNEPRAVPIPSRTQRYLAEVIQTSPYIDNAASLVFYGKDAFTPVDHKTVSEILYQALENIGIDDVERRMRNVSFQSWRHFFNTAFRTRIPDAKLQRLTGHRTQEMTEHYTHFNIEDFKDVQQIQEDLFR